MSGCFCCIEKRFFFFVFFFKERDLKTFPAVSVATKIGILSWCFPNLNQVSKANQSIDAALWQEENLRNMHLQHKVLAVVLQK